MVDSPGNKLKGLDNLPASGFGIKYPLGKGMIIAEKKDSTAFIHKRNFLGI